MTHLAATPAEPVRSWRVDLDPARIRWSCSAPDCPGVDLNGRRAPQVALGHLGDHAAAEPLAAHLRTCRCRAHGCVWHPRHRGCDGPVSMVVFRSHHSATWQLADACTACARAIPYAAQLRLPEEPAPGALRRPSPVGRVHVPRGAGDPGADGLASLVTYLDAALAPDTAPAVRLFALVCLLRADCGGAARLPRGLLRGWGLAGCHDEAVADLTRQRWLREQPATAGTPHTVRIGDSAGAAVLRTTSRRHRGRLLDQATRLLHRPSLPGRAHTDGLAALLTPDARGGLCPAQPAGPPPPDREVAR